jgi:hypothetical protein
MTRQQTWGKALTLAEATADAAAFGRRFRGLEDGPSVWDQLMELSRRYSFGGRQVHDANVVATMLAHGERRLTFNEAVFGASRTDRGRHAMMAIFTRKPRSRRAPATARSHLQVERVAASRELVDKVKIGTSRTADPKSWRVCSSIPGRLFSFGAKWPSNPPSG